MTSEEINIIDVRPGPSSHHLIVTNDQLRTIAQAVREYTFTKWTPDMDEAPVGALEWWSVEIEGHPRSSEYYDSPDQAMVSAVARKHTGARGAGGQGVGTLADWFMAACRGWNK